MEIVRNKGIKIPALTLVGLLEREGWTRGVPADGGWFDEHSKLFPTANVTAVIRYSGLPIGYKEGWKDQEVEWCCFLPGYVPEVWYTQHKIRVPLRKVDPVVISEVLRTLAELASKGK
jgi:hypothetical protein